MEIIRNPFDELALIVNAKMNVNDNRRDPFDVLCAIVAGEMDERRTCNCHPLAGLHEIGCASLQPAAPHSNDDCTLTTARLAMVAGIMKTQAHAIVGNYVDHEDLRERGEHLQAVLSAVNAYVSAVVENTAGNSAHLDNAAVRRAIDSMRDVAAQFGDATGDLLGPIFNAAEDCEEDR